VKKSLLRILKAALIGFIIVKLSTFGWMPIFSKKVQATEETRQTASNLQSTVKILSEDIGMRDFSAYSNLNKAAKVIQDAFKSYGYDVNLQNYTIDGKVYSNIIAHAKNWDKAKELIVVGAHYDSCFNPGADDNASGVAGLLELARLLKDHPSIDQIQFVAFTNEEPPFFSTDLMGSRVYAHRLHQEGFKVKGAIVLEMLGFYSEKPFSQRYLPVIGLFYPNQANFIAMVGNFPSWGLVQKLEKQFKRSSNFPISSIVAPSFIPGIYFSDHASFWKEGYRSVMVTDTAYLRNKNYHRMTDRLETINFEKMAYVVCGLKEAIVGFAK
jgi:Zn-dependent M28 family amino/carboxypeptidase